MIDPIIQDLNKHLDKEAETQKKIENLDLDAFMEGKDLYDIVDPLELGKEVLDLFKRYHDEPDYFGYRVFKEIEPEIYEAMKTEALEE